MITAEEARKLMQEYSLQDFINERHYFFDRINKFIKSYAKQQITSISFNLDPIDAYQYKSYYQEIFENLGFKVKFNNNDMEISWEKVENR